MLWDLKHVAVANISQFGGRFREEPIYVGTHKPPHFRDVPELMDQFISSFHENWYDWTATELAAYGLWRLNWNYPFMEGNGRTARAASYYLLLQCRTSSTFRDTICRRAHCSMRPHWTVRRADGRRCLHNCATVSRKVERSRRRGKIVLITCTTKPCVETLVLRSQSREKGLSGPARWLADRASQSGLVRRHHLHPRWPRAFLTWWW